MHVDCEIFAEKLPKEGYREGGRGVVRGGRKRAKVGETVKDYVTEAIQRYNSSLLLYIFHVVLH